ncbi:MAG: helix-turn-helix transcriptional regulator [Candidatus Nanoarchaeia archaeon]|jgi:DNA-binding XRE family transcriptional regulator|nr:helix-turn-helix transcriptional regulator [Candidatus Nanoarchaeia archaeon]
MNNLNSIIDATTPKPIAPKSNLAALLEATKKTDDSPSDPASGNSNSSGTASSQSSAQSTTNRESLKNEIVTARIQNGWTQKELANKCGCSQGTVNRAENNLRVSVYMLLKVASALSLKLHIN